MVTDISALESQKITPEAIPARSVAPAEVSTAPVFKDALNNYSIDFQRSFGNGVDKVADAIQDKAHIIGKKLPIGKFGTPFVAAASGVSQAHARLGKGEIINGFKMWGAALVAGVYEFPFVSKVADMLGFEKRTSNELKYQLAGADNNFDAFHAKDMAKKNVGAEKVSQNNNAQPKTQQSATETLADAGKDVRGTLDNFAAIPFVGGAFAAAGKVASAVPSAFESLIKGDADEALKKITSSGAGVAADLNPLTVVADGALVASKVPERGLVGAIKENKGASNILEEKTAEALRQKEVPKTSATPVAERQKTTPEVTAQAKPVAKPIVGEHTARAVKDQAAIAAKRAAKAPSHVAAMIERQQQSAGGGMSRGGRSMTPDREIAKEKTAFNPTNN